MRSAMVILTLVVGLAMTASAQDAPVIVTVFPAQNFMGAAVNSEISVTFDIDMNETTINSSSFVVNSRATGLHEGVITYDNVSKTATLVPDDEFRGGEVVTAVLTTEIQSSDGIALASSFSWSFTIAVPGGVDVFMPELTYPVHRAPTAVFIADLNGDFDLDIVTANQGAADISYLANNGDSTFASQVNFPVGEYPTSLSGGDLDGDGDVDLVCSSRRFDNVAVIFNNGQGFFGPQSGYTVGDYPMSVIVVDFDNDGDLDLATANMWSNDVTVLLNNGHGIFGARRDVGLPDTPVVSNVEQRWADVLSRLETEKKDLYEIFTEFPAGNGPYSVASGDLDNDGDMDLATANINDGTVTVLFNNGDATFSSGPWYEAGEFPSSITLVDLNSDSYLDIACSNMVSNSVSVFINLGTGEWDFSGEYVSGEYPVSIHSVDLDGDTDMDLITANSYSDDITVFYNDSDGIFSYMWNYSVGTTPFSVFSGDLTGDGGVDLVTANSTTDNVSLYFVVSGCEYYLPGDFNQSGTYNVVDILDLFSFLKTGLPQAGYFCECAGRSWGVGGDVNNTCGLDISDVVDGFSYLKTGSPAIEPCDLCLPSHP